MRPRLVAVLFSAVAMLVTTAAPAQATFPGANGKIAFVDIGSPCCATVIYTMNPDQSDLMQVPNTTGAGTPVWSPDGTRIAFSRIGPGSDNEIYVINADGTGSTQLTNNTVQDEYPAWSPDGTKIVFNRSSPGAAFYTINPDGTGESLLVANSGGRPDWSPLGDKIAYQSVDIWVMAADGTGATPVTTDPPTHCCDQSAYAPSWSPDGTRILFTQDYGVLVGDIEVMNADGSSRQKLTDNGFDQRSAVWSPDGRRMVYTDEQCSYCLVISDVDGSNRLEASLFGFEPDWQALPRASYPRPQSAATVSTALVPVFKQCGTGGNPANANHAPPIGGGSCSPPQPSSAVVHLGTQMQGSAAMTVTPGDSNPTNGDQANVALTTSLSDTQTTAGADYNPSASGADLTQVTRLRLTDQANGYGGTSGTAGDIDFSVPIDCAATSDPSVGSTCTVNTTTDTLMPGFAQEQRRTVIQVFRVRVYDAGLNGVRQNGTGDDKIFAHEGVFVP